MFVFLLGRIKERAFNDNKESYRYTVSGITVLLVVSLIRLFKHQHMFDSMPFLSETVYQNLIEAIGIIAGITLMIAGVSIWLPVRMRGDRKAGQEVQWYAALLKIEREILETEKLDRLFESIPKLVCGSFGFDSSAVFRLHRKSNRYICTNRYNFVPGTAEYIKGSKIESPARPEAIDNLKRTLKSSYSIYLNVNNETTAVIFFWKDEPTEISPDARVMLERIGEIFSHRLTGQLIAEKQDYFEKNWKYVLNARRVIANRSDIKGNIHNFQALFRDAVGSEYLSLAVHDRFRKNMKRYTAGADRRILLESGAGLPVENTQIDTVIASRKYLLIPDVTASSGEKIDSLFLSCGQRSLIAVPIMNHGRVTGVLTLGHPRRGYFNRRALIRAEMMAIALAPALESEISRRAIFERERFLGALAAFDTTAEECPDIKSLVKSAADLLMENIQTTMIRVTTMDRERSHLITRHLKTIRPFNHINTEKTGISKELTPWHQMVLQENRLLLINQNDSESSMSTSEASALVFDGMKSALIVPIVTSGITYGLITLGEMRNWNRFAYDSATILFCKAIAAKVATGIKTLQMSLAITRLKPEQISHIPDSPPRENVLQELKTPVSRIQGSVELLRSKGKPFDEDSEKLVSRIHDSAERLVTLINRDEDLIPQ